jgi:hypothetical protein
MPDLLKAFTVIFLINATITASGQAVDSTLTSQIKDTLKTVIADTVFMSNGDKITGNILSYEEGRLRIDAQSAGVINIKYQKIYSIGGGSRLFYVKDMKGLSYIGNINSSVDTGKIILSAQQVTELRFKDIASFRPIKNITDTIPVVTEKAQKPTEETPDTIFLKNRERYTGSILSMEQGRIKIDAQGSGVINIKWHKILTITGGNRLYKVEDQQGEIYVGRIEASKDTGEIIIKGDHTYTITLEDIAHLYPLEDKWYRGFKGTLGGGFNYTKSSDVLNINFDYNIHYVKKKWLFINNLSYIETSTHEEDGTVRLSVDLAALYSLPGRWVLSGINSYNRNDELGIKSRISFGVGGGYNLVLTERQRLLALTGVIQNTETNVGSNTAVSNFELPLTLNHTVYSFLRPDLTSTTEISYYEGLTEGNRYRVDISTDITWAILKWMDLKLSFYYDFDNKNVEGKESQEDYGTVLSLLVDLK